MAATAKAAAAAPKRRAPLTDSDMVLVKPTVPSRLELAHATMRAGRGEDVASGSPSARQALRAVYVMSNASLAQELQAQFGRSMNETYLTWHDREDFRRPGDSRVALAPWLAHKALGDTYKWILFGDDDTYFFLDGVKHLLRDYDPDLPYVVTDLVVHKGTAFHSDAPRCLPCHVTPAFRAFVAARPDAPGIGSGKEEDENPRYTEAPVPPSGCPCTPDLACEWHLNVTGQRHLLNRTAPLSSLAASRGAMDQDNPTNCQFPGFHGGYGVLISVGAMRKVSYEAALECFYDDLNSFTATSYWKAKGHGDQLTSGCFWRHGVALTDPGISLTHRSTTNGASRVMNSRTANVESLEKLLAGELPAHWLWNFILMAGSHVQHHGKSVPMTWKLGKLYRQGFPYAVAALKRLGQWGRGVQDAQVDPSGGWGWRGQPWEREAWDRAGDAEWKRGANFSEALGGEGEGRGDEEVEQEGRKQEEDSEEDDDDKVEEEVEEEDEEPEEEDEEEEAKEEAKGEEEAESTGRKGAPDRGHRGGPAAQHLAVGSKAGARANSQEKRREQEHRRSSEIEELLEEIEAREEELAEMRERLGAMHRGGGRQEREDKREEERRDLSGTMTAPNRIHGVGRRLYRLF